MSPPGPAVQAGRLPSLDVGGGAGRVGGGEEGGVQVAFTSARGLKRTSEA